MMVESEGQISRIRYAWIIIVKSITCISWIDMYISTWILLKTLYFLYEIWSTTFFVLDFGVFDIICRRIANYLVPHLIYFIF